MLLLLIAENLKKKKKSTKLGILHRHNGPTKFYGNLSTPSKVEKRRHREPGDNISSISSKPQVR
jgi:hypothetical protein